MKTLECTPSLRVVKISKEENDAIDEALREKKKGISLEELHHKLIADRLKHRGLLLAL